MHSIMQCDTQEQNALMDLIECTFYEVVAGKSAGRPAKLSALRKEISNASDYDMAPSVRESMGGLDGFLSSYL